jgi:peptide-methionine (S)-S-oxide reductase
VCGAQTGHTEAVQVLFDPAEVSYEQLCAVLMGRLGRSMFLVNQVGNDRGPQYRHGIYTHTAEQARVAADVLAQLQKQVGSTKIATELEPAEIYWPAEEYHQQYLAKGGRNSRAQSAEKGCTTEIRCYG